jgi:hypothetical protein
VTKRDAQCCTARVVSAVESTGRTRAGGSWDRVRGGGWCRTTGVEPDDGRERGGEAVRMLMLMGMALLNDIVIIIIIIIIKTKNKSVMNQDLCDKSSVETFSFWIGIGPPPPSKYGAAVSKT